MDNWLKVKDIVDLPCTTYNGKFTDRNFYYTKNEIKKYENKNPDPGSRYHDIDCLFKKLVDHCLDYSIVNNDNTPIISSINKRQFFKFVYATSKK